MNTTALAHRPHAASKPSLLKRFLAAYAIRMQRQKLGQLDDAALRDIGLSRHQAQAEAARPLFAVRWNAPDNWMR